MKIADMQIHPVAARFPLLSDEKMKALANDIKARGQLHPAVVFDDQLLDGRNRILACEIAGVEPKIDVLAACPSPTEYILSTKRRQLTLVQLVAFAVDPVVIESCCAERRGQQAIEKRASNDRRPTDEPVAVLAKACGSNRTDGYRMQRVQRTAPGVYEAARLGRFKTVVEASRAAERTPKPTVKRSAARKERDEEVRRLHEKENLAPHEIAKRLSCSPGAVQDAKRRLGLNGKVVNPLDRITRLAVEFSDTWEILITANASQWASATPEQIAELTKCLSILRQRTTILIRRLQDADTGEAP